MDFLIAQSEPSDAVRALYNPLRTEKEVWVGSVLSGNQEVIESATGPVAVIAGSISGALADAKNVRRVSREELGRHAKDSDGSFAAAIPKDQSVTVVTDAGGSIPVFYGHGPEGWAVGTRVHDVAVSTGLDTVDRVSAVDFLMNASVCYPYSWYEDVRMVPPGSACTVGREEMTCHTYWVPEEPADLYKDCDCRPWGRRLRARTKAILHSATAGAERGRVLFSGGTDSRAVLSLMPAEFKCIPTTVLSSKNREYRLAKRSARLLGRELELIQRPENYYRWAIPDRIDRIGPGFDFRHTHLFGPVADQFEDADVVVGGYLADTLFKSHYMSNVARHNTRPDSLLDPCPDEVKPPPGDVGGSPLSTTGGAPFQAQLVAAVQERRREHHHRLKEFRPQTAGNWHRLWPLSTLAYGSYLSSLRMQTKMVEPFLFHENYQLAARMPDAARVDRRAFRAAFADDMGAAGWWPTDSGRIPRLGGYLGNAVRVPIRGTQRLLDALRASDGEQGSWPPFQWGWHNVQVDEHFPEEGTALYQQRLNELMTEEAAREQFSDDDFIPARLRALTLAFGAKKTQ